MTPDQPVKPIVLCERCGRQLKDEVSRELRKGPVCRAKRVEPGASR